MSNSTTLQTDLLTTADGALAYTDYGGNGPLMLLLPGAGDLRSEHRFLAPELSAAGYRVVTMDLRGHGDSSPQWPGYGVADTAADISAMVRHLDHGPAVLVANSFAPAASLWLAADHPELVAGVVAISPHLTQDAGRAQQLAFDALLRGPWAGRLWAKLYRGWYKADPPRDLGEQVELLRSMMGDSRRRAAVRATLLAHREGLAEKLTRLTVPVLAVFGDADDHFDDPTAEAQRVAAQTRGAYATVAGAGHYPHVEQPQQVADLILDFVTR